MHTRVRAHMTYLQSIVTLNMNEDSAHVRILFHYIYWREKTEKYSILKCQKNR